MLSSASSDVLSAPDVHDSGPRLPSDTLGRIIDPVHPTSPTDGDIPTDSSYRSSSPLITAATPLPPFPTAARETATSTEATVAGSVGCLRLPVEILEYIIDIAGDSSSGTISDSGRAVLRACLLVCRAFAPRCRFHLANRIILRSKEDLANVAKMITMRPDLAIQNLTLTIDVVGAGPQGWVSAIPRTLPLSVMDIMELDIRGVDFTTLHGTFPAAFSRVDSVCTLRLEDIRYSRYSQVTQFIRAVKARYLRWDVDHTSPIDRSSSRAFVESGLVGAHPGRLSLPRVIKDITWSTTWDLLLRCMLGLPRTHLSSTSFARWHCSVSSATQGVPDAYRGAVLGEVARTFERFASGNRKLYFELSAPLPYLKIICEYPS